MAEVGCLKDGQFQNLQVEGFIEGAGIEKARAVNLAGSPLAAVAGDMIVVTNAAPGAITLPAAKAGAKIRVLHGIGNTTPYAISAPTTGPSISASQRFNILSSITLEDKAADTANTFAAFPSAGRHTLTITLGGIGTHLEFIGDGYTWLVIGEIAAIAGTAPTIAYTG